MKETGITRKLDELGRIVIPMEIRKDFKMNVGDSIEFYVHEDKIIIKKHDDMTRYNRNIKSILELIKSKYDLDADFFTPFNSVEVTEQFDVILKKKTKITASHVLINEDSEERDIYVLPVISFGEYLGSLTVYIDEDIDLNTLKSLDLMVDLICILYQS